MRARLIAVSLGMVLAGCVEDDAISATVAPVLEPCTAPPIDGPSMCYRVTDDGMPSRLVHRGLLYFQFEWGVEQRIRYAAPRGDEGINCIPDSSECHRVVDAEVSARLPVGSPITITFRSTGTDRRWLAPTSTGFRMGLHDVESTPAVTEQALGLDEMAVAYRIDVELTGARAVPLRAVAVAPI